MRVLNRVLRRFGYIVTPTPPSAKMLREHANVSETHHPSRGGNTVAWMRDVADRVDGG
ncbi:hypothetical protein GCM10009548_01640 [Streptomyces malaysiensis subsp. malaysiensis]